MAKMKIDIHADDYALTPNTSKDMIECMKAGKLNSISIVPNTKYFSECMDMLYEAIPSMPFLPLMSVHIDLVEGSSLTGTSDEISIYKNEDGRTLLNLSWGKLFALSYLIGRKNRIYKCLEDEIAAQIKRCGEAINRCVDTANKSGIPYAGKGLRIDSHQHAHHIPIVWEALTKVLEREGITPEYIRNSKEPLWVFLSEKSLIRTYRPVNIIKNRILALYSHKIDRYCVKNHIQKMYLWGLIMSGRMDSERIEKLIGKVYKKAERDKRDIEILFHPGLMLEEEYNGDVAKDAADDFYLKEDRHVEKDAVMNINFNMPGKDRS